MAIGQFAGFLRAAREKAGITQVALAGACGLTGSYISLLESGKKPAPSDRVVRKIAKALSLGEVEALEGAHLDRAPDDLRRSVERLTRQAALEREMRERTAEALFPLSLWNIHPSGVPFQRLGHRPPSLGARIVEAIDRLLDLARTSPDVRTFQARSREMLDALPEEDRRKVLEAAPAVVREAGPSPAVRVLPAPGAGFPPEVHPGDSLVVEEGTAPKEGDLVLVEGEGESRLVRFGSGTTGVRGVVVEVRRSLRRK